ncbi:BPI fold-containing family B member 1 [Dromiciops gliroides]|uniref:BPI fold-containing family B member 1 n=1 Tax=Dromiciops gliroides TaxID=33562 RepID=UPI001CC74E49|nr:BPI fold-containing family B member 1 [Dromiciops gliroides]
MFQPWGLVFLWGFLMMPPAQAEPRGQAVLNIGPEILNKVFFQELKNQDVIEILKNLPLYEAMKKNQVSSIPLIGDLVSSFLKQIVWLRVTEASIPKLAFQLSEKGHLQIRIPMDMVAGLNTIISKKLIELHMEVAIIAEVSTVTDVPGNSHVVLSQCTDIPSNLRIELLQTFSFAINILANKVIDALMPTLPTLVKREVCPVIERAFKSMTSKINIWATLPVPIGSNFMDFEVLSSSIVDNTFQLDLNAQLLDMGGKLMKVFNDSQGSLTVPKMDGLKFNFIVRQDVVSAAIGALLPPKELAVLLDSVLPELARELKSILNNINPTASEQLGPTQIVKIFTQEPPEIILKVGSARVLQLIVFEVFATNQATRPLFTLGIETSSDGQFYTEESRLYLNIKGISSDHIYLMNSGTGLFSPELLGSVINEILLSVLLPNQNGVLRDGISLSAFREYGFDEAKVIPIQGALLITPA